MVKRTWFTLSLLVFPAPGMQEKGDGQALGSSPAAAKFSGDLPKLLPGEGLAILNGEGKAILIGDVETESPMGGLAKLLWLRMEGNDWALRKAEFKCPGEIGGIKCCTPKGHGKVNLTSAFQQDCDLAVYAWAQWSYMKDAKLYGEAQQRARMEDAFGPFLGKRSPWKNGSSDFSMDWIGRGDMLRSSPSAMLQWLMDPHQEGFLGRCRRVLLGYVKSFSRNHPWWLMVTSTSHQERTWIAGSDGQLLAVFRLPYTNDKPKAVERFKQLLLIK